MDRGLAHRRAAMATLWIATAVAASSAWAQDRGAVSPSAPHPVTTRELVEVRGLSGLSVSPDGAYAVVRLDRQYIGANQALLDWRIVRLRDGRTTRIADGGAPRWTNNG